MAVYFSAIGSGLGDIVVSLPILQQLIARGERVYLVAKSERQENLEALLPGLTGIIREPDLDEENIDGSYHNFRAHPIQTTYDWTSPEFHRDFPGINIQNMLEIICRDFGLDVDFRRPLEPLPFTFHPEWSQTIVFVPGTVIDTKSWPVRRWFELYQALKSDGHRVLMIGEPDRAPPVKQLQELGVPWLATPNITDVVDTVSSCRAVVSVDTGIMHLSVHQNKPTVALFENSPLYYRPHPCCRPLFASPCQKECIEAFSFSFEHREKSPPWAWYHGQFERCTATEELKCMNSISVTAVLAQLKDFIEPVPHARPAVTAIGTGSES
ncbi:MAG: hypothetical protein C5B53_10250 [Candidatus Melainabacteria bacterium]|nr:MAG: hypothetical protein C5B53_10250 [Candidatus Melainabacteria bacterium]